MIIKIKFNTVWLVTLISPEKCHNCFWSHGLGHGTGLEIHEAPFISTRTSEDKVFLPGNIITLEPGLYDAETGGCRLENDVLITDTGNCILTNSRIIRI